MQPQLQAKYIKSLPIVGALPGQKDVYEYRGFRYSIFYHPIYARYQIGVAAPHRAAWGLLGRNWRDVAVNSAQSLEGAHTLAQTEINRMIAAGERLPTRKKRA